MLKPDKPNAASDENIYELIYPEIEAKIQQNL